MKYLHKNPFFVFYLILKQLYDSQNIQICKYLD